ncbi:hypothetical protein TNCV_4702121 [Trichonephila clavipes]|uniref:Uncharacterized protein n=1 Tax=Trichonephila clavipes TaxID=2585209 RepID=A0A8X6WIG6_TRICX|nr:hypothetical protein TNCV_4702121 [Trichonephila clavipes]
MLLPNLNLSPRGNRVNDHSTQHPIREQSLSSQPSQKTQKLFTQMKNHSHASRTPSPNQSPSCHSAECQTPLMPNIIDSHDMGLRTVLQSRRPKINAYSTPIQRAHSHLVVLN